MSCGTKRRLVLSFILLVTISLACCQKRRYQYNRQQRKPNIVFIMADDLGWNDIGFHNSFIKTPNIDQLARDGIELTSHYVQPVCSATRGALMTGRYPSNNGVYQAVIAPQTKSCLPLEFKILPQYMKDAGYATKYVGKWHLGGCSKDCLATRRGFDEFRGIIAGQVDYFNWEFNGTYQRVVDGEISLEKMGTHLSLVEKIDVREMITTHKQQNSRIPLFMVVSPLAPHTPLQVTKEMFDIHDTLTTPESRGRRTYLGLVSALDDIVGETIQSLKDNGMYENTVIIFTSDNGGTNEALIPILPAPGNNYPLRGQKSQPYEGGVRAPTIYFDPRLPPSTRGTKRDFLMHVTDWLPTFLQLAKRRISKGSLNIDGKSQITNLQRSYRPNKYRIRDEFLILITDATSLLSRPTSCSNINTAFRYRDWKLVYGEAYNNSDGIYKIPEEAPTLPSIEGDSCIRTENGRLVIRCLFNLRYDPSEQQNLYDRFPRRVAQLLNRIDFYQSTRVEPVFKPPVGPTNENTIQAGDLLLPRFGHCNPSTDFPLRAPQGRCRRENIFRRKF